MMLFYPLSALSLVTEFDPNIYSDARLARFFVVVLLHTEYHNFSTSADIINQQPTLLLRGTKRAVALSKPRIPPSSSSSSSSSIDGNCSNKSICDEYQSSIRSMLSFF